MSIPELPTGVCQVWWAQVVDDGRDLLGLLDEAERSRWHQFRVDSARALYAAAHAVARVVLAEHLGAAPRELRFDTTCRRCGAAHGKPRLPDGELELSLSHSGRYVAVAVTRAVAIGVDVEEIALRGDLIPTVALSPAERAMLETMPEAERVAAFVRYWTRKEALVKATGHGMSIGLQRITVSHPRQPPELLAWRAAEPAPPLVHLVDLDAPAGYSANLAVLGPAQRVARLDATPLLAAAASR